MWAFTIEPNGQGTNAGRSATDFGALESSPFRNLFDLKGATSRRVSSWDRTGGNDDWLSVGPGETATLMDVSGAGCITHFYWTMIGNDPYDLRRAVLRMYWDGSDTPGVEVPLGDLFGAANCIVPLFTSELLTINRGTAISFGFNSYFPMPFGNGARVTLENESPTPLGGALNAFWYHIEYEQYDESIPDTIGRFHAQWRRERLTQSAHKDATNVQIPRSKANLDGKENYVILDAEGHGQVVGLVLNVDNVAGGWWGEGDDMIFVDGDTWPPRYHGTGTEEIFGGGASPNRPFFGPYTGYSTVQNLDYARNTTQYRWYVHDPIRFRKSVRFTIEHGHADTFENDYSSVVYWYQALPAKKFPPLPPADERLPLPSEDYTEAHSIIMGIVEEWFSDESRLTDAQRDVIFEVGQVAGEAFYTGRWGEALEKSGPLREILGSLD